MTLRSTILILLAAAAVAALSSMDFRAVDSPAPPELDASASAETGQVREPAVRATIVDEDGVELGSAQLRSTPDGGVLIRVQLIAAPPGTHGFHVHETGRCEPDFSAAGDHYAPRGNDHGFFHQDGPHAGDLPNLHVDEDGTLDVEILAPELSLLKDATGTLLDEDGSAFILHEDADDYMSQPSGGAGPEVACGVIG